MPPMSGPATEILTPEQMYKADALATASGVASLKLMENAGRAVVDVITSRFKRCRVVVLCGPGNNGGDGYVVARLLAAKKWPVAVYAVGDVKTLKGDAALMARKFKGAIASFEAFGASLHSLTKPQLIVDAIFGAGLNRDFPDTLAKTIMGAALPIVAVDVPSGLDGETGQVRGSSLQADVTVTFFRKKPAHVLMRGRQLCGEVVVADIGIPDAVLEKLDISLHENAAPVLPAIWLETHKFRRGHSLIWSGPEFNTGAARLAAMSAARIGSGLTTIVGPPEALRVHAAHCTSVMLKPVETVEDLRVVLIDKRITSVCIGPAATVSEATRKNVRAILKSGIATVLDADALSSFAEEAANLFAAIASNGSRACVMTPHEGEFARLFPTVAARGADKVMRARTAAKLSGAVVVLKGPDTIIAAPDGQARINSNAPPTLATAGSGDVLAGIITGLLAQGMGGFEAACAGVWLHGDAANRTARRTLIAEDLVDALGRL